MTDRIDGDGKGDGSVERAPNISTEHQKSGDARRPNDTLDRDQPPAGDDGGRKSSLTGPD